MSLAGQVLCQRMLIWPCARTIVGATIVAAAPAVATFRKRRRLDALPLLDLVIVLSRLDFDPFGISSFVGRRQGLAQLFGKNASGWCDARTRSASRKRALTSKF